MTEKRRPLGIDTATVLTLGTRGIQIAAGVAASIVTARFLAPAGRGEYFVAVTLARTLAQFGGLGQQSSNTFLVARDENLFKPLVANSFWTSIVVCGGGALLAVAFMNGTGAVLGGASLTTWLAVVLAPISLFYMLGTNLLVGTRRFGQFNAFELASALLLLIAVTAAGLAGAGPSGFMLASVVGWLIITAVLARRLWALGARSLRFRKDVLRSSVRYSTKAYLATLAGFLLLRGNVFMLNAIQGAEQVGFYSVATQVADVLAVLPQSAALVLFPTLVREGVNGFEPMMRSLMAVGALLAASCVAMGLLGEPLVQLAFGAQFRPSGAVLIQLLPGVFFAGITNIVSQYLSAIGFPRAQVAIWFAGFGAAMGLSWMLIPRFGANGAAAALSATHLMMFLMMFALARTLRRHQQAILPPEATHA